MDAVQAIGPLAPYLESMWASSLETLAALAEQAEREVPAPGAVSGRGSEGSPR